MPSNPPRTKTLGYVEVTASGKRVTNPRIRKKPWRSAVYWRKCARVVMVPEGKR